MSAVVYRTGVYPLVGAQILTTYGDARRALISALESLNDPAAWGMTRLIPEQPGLFAQHVIEPFFFAYITPVGEDGRVIHQ